MAKDTKPYFCGGWVEVIDLEFGKRAYIFHVERLKNRDAYTTRQGESHG